MPATEKILVAMSGGVDSSVAALLLKRRGFDVSGAYMKNWINEDGVVGRCPWEGDIEDARRVTDSIGIEFQVVNLIRDYKERVVRYLLESYEAGLTPNPDVRCNRDIKFGVFRAWARDYGYSAIATGHYVRRSQIRGQASDCGAALRPHHNPRPDPFALPDSPKSDTFALLEGADKNKDQSYFLALLSQEQIRGALFPIGNLTKPEVRRLAREAGLATADKKDSQGICFIGQVKMGDFLRAYVPDRPGPIVRAGDGCQLGQHKGLHLFTLGQRKGIGIPSNADNERYVVVGKRAADHALLVAFDHPGAPGLFQKEVRVHGLVWNGEPVREARFLEGRVRYRDPRVPLEFMPEDGGRALVRFKDAQRALAPGQVLALYEGERLLGGGIYA